MSETDTDPQGLVAVYWTCFPTSGRLLIMTSLLQTCAGMLSAYASWCRQKNDFLSIIRQSASNSTLAAD